MATGRLSFVASVVGVVFVVFVAVSVMPLIQNANFESLTFCHLMSLGGRVLLRVYFYYLLQAAWANEIQQNKKKKGKPSD